MGAPSPRVRDYRGALGRAAAARDPGRRCPTAAGSRRHGGERRRWTRTCPTRPSRSRPTRATGRSTPPKRGGSGARGEGLRVPSFAKVNLGLEVLGVRQDGYHELRTIFQTIDLRDDIVLRRQRPRASTRALRPSRWCPRDAANLAARAAARAAPLRQASRTAWRSGSRKRIPVGGGLGGGSSNAAAVLLGLDRMWRLGLGPVGPAPAGPPARGRRPLSSSSGARPWAWRAGTRSTRSAGRSRPTSCWSIPGRPLSTAAVFRGWTGV